MTTDQKTTVDDIDREIAELRLRRAAAVSRELVTDAFNAIDLDSPTAEDDKLTTLCRVAGVTIERRLREQLNDGKGGWLEATFDPITRAREQLDKGQPIDAAAYLYMAIARAALQPSEGA